MADLFISSPQRAVIEIKSMIALGHARMQMEAVRKEFEGQVRCILVVISTGRVALDNPVENDWLEIIEVSGHDAPVNAAFNIRDRLFGSLPADRLKILSWDDLADTLPETGPLSDVLVNFRTRMAEDAFQVLRLEAENLLREYKSAHYTTCALCVVRMLEFVLYTLAKSWGVPINKRTIKILNNLENRFRELSRSMVDYAYAEDEREKEKAKDALRKRLTNFNTDVMTTALALHEDHEKIPTEIPVNTQSLLGDIKRKFGRIETVRREIHFLDTGGLIQGLRAMRNRAAHANTSGGRTEYGKKDIDLMLEDLRAILFRLGNIADAIARDA